MPLARSSVANVFTTPTLAGLFSTAFPTVENPISQNGVWVRGGVEGLAWQNPKTVASPARCCADATTAVGTYTDPIAILKPSAFSIGANHGCDATVYLASGYTPPSSHEVNLFLRGAISANSCRGYEINVGFGASGAQIVRWNGAVGSFDVHTTTISFPAAIAQGDRIKATAVGNVITVLTKQGADTGFVSRGTLDITTGTFATGSVWSDGMPGLDCFLRPGTGATPESYCWSDFNAYSL